MARSTGLSEGSRYGLSSFSLFHDTHHVFIRVVEIATMWFRDSGMSFMIFRTLVFLAVIGCVQGQVASPTPSPIPSPAPKPTPAPVASMEPSELKGFAEYPEAVQQLISEGLALTKQNLTYKFGSADPAKGGMDCSGTIYFVLRQVGVMDVPRSASGQYLWTRKAGTFLSVISRKMDSYELQALKPGDLLFWSGTYATEVDPPVTHAMIYLGKRKKDGKAVMFGASDGRSYDGKGRWGVSVFDFRIPKPAVKGATIPPSVFIGYAKIPGLGDE